MKVSILLSYFLVLVSAGFRANDKEIATVRKVIKQNNLESFCVKYVPPQTQTKTHWKTITKYVTSGKATTTTTKTTLSTVLLTATSTMTSTDLKFSTDRSILDAKQTELKTAPTETVVDATTTTNIITTNAAAPTAIKKRAAKIDVPKELKKFCDIAVVAACRSINKPVKKSITRTKTRTKTVRCTRTQTNTSTHLATKTTSKTATATTSKTSTLSETTTRTSVTTSVTTPVTTVQTTLSTATTTTTPQPSPTGPAALCDFANNPKINQYAYSAIIPAPPGQVDGGVRFQNFGNKERCCNACATSSGCAIWQSFDGGDCNLLFPQSIKKRAVVPMVKRQNQCPAGMFVGRYDVYKGLEELVDTWAGPGPCLSDLQIVDVDWEEIE